MEYIVYTVFFMAAVMLTIVFDGGYTVGVVAVLAVGLRNG